MIFHIGLLTYEFFQFKMFIIKEVIMSKNIYAGNLSFKTNEDSLVQLFSPYGQVIGARLVYDRDTNQSKGFGFVEMDDSADTDKAVAQLNGKEVDGRKIRVNYAEVKRDNTQRKEENRARRDSFRKPGSPRGRGSFSARNNDRGSFYKKDDSREY